MIYSRIAGTGSYLPERILTNAELEKLVETSDEWIISRTGIQRRHIAAEGQSTCDLAEFAARQALEMAECTAKDIELIILGTTTPDRIHPATACLLQARLDNLGVPAFDIQAACGGFIYGLSIADKFIKTGTVQRALVIGAEICTRILNWKDRGTAVLFGDGAGAVVVEASQTAGILSTHLHTDGSYNEVLHGNGTVIQGQIRNGSGLTQMQGGEVFKFAITALSSVAEEALNTNQLTAQDIDWFIPHQANLRIIQAVVKKTNIPLERTIVTVQDHGNTSSASVPLALDVAVRDGRIQRGDTVLLEAIGGGFTWGAALVKF
jgi:3-oxoacyl-[acyl-carrier-protein] synthase-3